MSTCCGCGAPLQSYSIVAIVRENGVWMSKPTCDPCWRDPAHRTTLIKGHFFPKSQEALALSRAGSSDIGG